MRLLRSSLIMVMMTNAKRCGSKGSRTETSPSQGCQDQGQKCILAPGFLRVVTCRLLASLGQRLNILNCLVVGSLVRELDQPTHVWHNKNPPVGPLTWSPDLHKDPCALSGISSWRVACEPREPLMRTIYGHTWEPHAQPAPRFPGNHRQCCCPWSL